MTPATSDSGTVLVVEDEKHLADLYTEYLTDLYTVRTAYGGAEAIDMLAPDIDVVLLDRRMPVVSGNEVLAAIGDSEFEMKVAMVTAVDPDFDIIDLGVDDYLVKPVSKSALRDVVDRLLTIAEYNRRVQELTSKRLTRNVLQVEKPLSELEESEQYTRLEAEIDELERELDELSEDLEKDDIVRHR